MDKHIITRGGSSCVAPKQAKQAGAWAGAQAGGTAGVSSRRGRAGGQSGRACKECGCMGSTLARAFLHPKLARCWVFCR